jgi:ABC-2 type transport system permease protein
MTPVQAKELILGKLTPYLILTVVEMCSIVLLMVIVFRVPINGNFLTLMAIAVPFILTTLGLGLGISTKANTTDEAGQLVMGTVMPSIFLSGYVFPVDSMPWIFQQIALVVPTTWLIDASRGVILRGAGWRELWLHATILWGMAAAVLTFSALRFHKKVG